MIIDLRDSTVPVPVPVPVPDGTRRIDLVVGDIGYGYGYGDGYEIKRWLPGEEP